MGKSIALCAFTSLLIGACAGTPRYTGQIPTTNGDGFIIGTVRTVGTLDGPEFTADDRFVYVYDERWGDYTDRPVKIPHTAEGLEDRLVGMSVSAYGDWYRSESGRKFLLAAELLCADDADEHSYSRCAAVLARRSE